jgi:hypothetical protein
MGWIGQGIFLKGEITKRESEKCQEIPEIRWSNLRAAVATGLTGRHVSPVKLLPPVHYERPCLGLQPAFEVGLGEPASGGAGPGVVRVPARVYHERTAQI